MRRLTVGRWIEAALLAPATLLLLPFLLMGMLGSAVTAVFSADSLTPDSWRAMQIMMAMAVIALVDLAALWALVLLGPEPICRRPLLRGLVLASALAGLAIIGWMLHPSFGMPLALKAPFFFGPALVGLRYLPALLGFPRAGNPP